MLALSIDQKVNTVDRPTLEQARANVKGAVSCNYAFSITATTGNDSTFDEELRVLSTTALFIPLTSALVSTISSSFH